MTDKNRPRSPAPGCPGGQILPPRNTPDHDGFVTSDPRAADTMPAARSPEETAVLLLAAKLDVATEWLKKIHSELEFMNSTLLNRGRW